MPVKVIAMLKRKEGMTHDEFRTAYEERHSRIGVELFGHLWSEYRRNYLGPANSFAAESGMPTHAAGAEADCPYDVMTEFVFPDSASLEESNRIAAVPDNKRLLSEDEETLFDRKRCWVSVCEVLEEDLSQLGER